MASSADSEQKNNNLCNNGTSLPKDESKPFEYNELSRRQLRSLLFHLLYAMDNYEYTVSLASIINNFNHGFDLNIPVDGEVAKNANSIIQERDELDAQLKPLLDNWSFERLGLCTKLILRLALWEFNQGNIEIPIIINEAIELSKCFAEKDAYKFINGVLDKKMKQIQQQKQT